MSSRVCAGCNEDIPAIRLKAKPNARFCVPCQSTQDVLISDTPLTSAYSFNRSFGTQSEHSLREQPARDLLSTRGLSEYIAAESVDYSGRARNTNHIVFSETGRAA